MAKIHIDDAEHPLRNLAICIIEEIIEPCLLEENKKHKGINGEKYYELEDKVVSLLVRKKLKIKSK